MGFLEQESIKANKKNRKLFLILFFVYIVLIAGIGFAIKDSLDLSDYKTKKVLAYAAILTFIMLFCVIFMLIKSSRPAVNGKNLLLPFKENTKEAVGMIVDREVADGMVQVDEYIDKFKETEKPHGERIMLLPSYLLLFNGMGAITAIPRNKIYWICAQVGRKGASSFIVRLMIFTEIKTFYMDGVEIAHVEGIAKKLYQYIPNIFSEYDPFILSYELDKLFDKNREEFLRFYEGEKKKYDLYNR